MGRRAFLSEKTESEKPWCREVAHLRKEETSVAGLEGIKAECLKVRSQRQRVQPG